MWQDIIDPELSEFDESGDIVKAVIRDGVRNVPRRAFKSCYSLTSVKMPGTVITIGNEAFYDCINLESLEVPDGVISIGANAFFHCLKLTELVLPDTVDSIGEYAFQNCIAFKFFKIPAGLRVIEKYLLFGCSDLCSVFVPEGVMRIRDGAFLATGINNINIPKSVNEIGAHAFAVCCSLTHAALPQGVVQICPDLFRQCKSLEFLIIPDSVTIIAPSFLYDCDRIKFIFIDTGIKAKFDRIRSSFPLEWQSRIVFGKKIFDQIFEIRQGVVKECKALSSVLFKRLLPVELLSQILSYVDEEDAAIMALIRSVALPVYEGNDEEFISAYTQDLNHFKYRYLLACKIKSFFKVKDNPKKPLLETILDKVEDYGVHLHFSLQERISIAQSDILFPAFLLCITSDARMNAERYNFIKHKKPKCLSAIIRALEKTDEGKEWVKWEDNFKKLYSCASSEELALFFKESAWNDEKNNTLISVFRFLKGRRVTGEWLNEEGNFVKCIKNEKLKELMHFFTGAQWAMERNDLLEGKSKIDGLFNEKEPYRFIVQSCKDKYNKSEPMFNRVRQSIFGSGNGYFFSRSQRKGHGYLFGLAALFQICIALEIPYKKETIFNIKDPVSGLKNPWPLVKNLCRLQEQAKNQRLDTTGPLSILLEYLKKSDVSEIPPALWETSFSASPEECESCNSYIARTNQERNKHLKRR